LAFRYHIPREGGGVIIDFSAVRTAAVWCMVVCGG
jgi:hypothetical protein